MKTLKVVLGLITRDNDYQREQASVAEATARRLGIALQVLYADNDAITQTKQLLAAIHAAEPERPDAILVEPVGTGMLGVASTAVEKRIGWVALNREADYLAPLRRGSTVPIGSVVCDNAEVGRIQGRQFAALLPGGGTVLFIEGPATDVTKQRRAGLDETLAAAIKLRTGRGDWTEGSAYQVVASRLQWHGASPPDLGVIGCQNDAMAMGARRAVETLAPAAQRDRWLAVRFTGVDGVPGSGQDWVHKGLLAATVVTPALTGTALELLHEALAGGAPMPERTVAAATSFPSIEELRARAASPAARQGS
jgi:ribose transport system substrate-binding protein